MPYFYSTATRNGFFLGSQMHSADVHISWRIKFNSNYNDVLVFAFAFLLFSFPFVRFLMRLFWRIIISHLQSFKAFYFPQHMSILPNLFLFLQAFCMVESLSLTVIWHPHSKKIAVFPWWRCTMSQCLCFFPSSSFLSLFCHRDLFIHPRLLAVLWKVFKEDWMKSK